MMIVDKNIWIFPADISDKGIYMTCGGCWVDRLDKLLKEKLGINVMIAQDVVSVLH